MPKSLSRLLRPFARNVLLLRRLRDDFRQALRLYEEVGSSLRAGKTGDFFEQVSPTFTWSSHYELPYFQHLVYALVALGLHAGFEATAKKLLKRQEHALWGLFRGEAKPPKGVSPDLLFGLAISLKFTLLSLLQQHTSLNALVMRVRAGDRDAIFDVVRIDPSATSNPSIAFQISKAVLGQDSAFLEKLGGVIKDNAAPKLRKRLELDLMLMLVDSMGGLEGMTAEQQKRLFVRDLQVYEMADDSDPRSLSTYIARWQKQHATNIRREMSSPSDNSS